MAGLVKPLVGGIQAGRREHADGAGEHRCLIAEDVAKHIAGDHNIKFLGLAHQLHGGVVNIHVVQRYIRILLANVTDHVFPELEGFQYIGLVHAGDAFAAFTCRLECHMGNALDFWPGVAHGVESFFCARKQAVCGDSATAWLAKINIASELADDQDIEPGNQLGLQAGGVNELLVANGRTKISEQAQMFSQP